MSFQTLKVSRLLNSPRSPSPLKISATTSRLLQSTHKLFLSALLIFLLLTPQSSVAQTSSQSPNFSEAHKLLQQGKFDDALSLLLDLQSKNPSAKNLAHELGSAYYKKADYSNAALYLKKALIEDPSDNEATQLLGLSYYLSGKPSDAVPFLEKVQTWYPSANVDASYILGICYIQTKDYSNARKAFAKMFGVAPESAASYLFTARMLLRQDFAPIAEEYAQKSVALDPQLPLAHQLLGEIYLFKANIPAAIEQFQKEIEVNPGNANGYYKLADAYSRIQKFEEAEKFLQRSIWLDANSTGPYILLGKVLQKKGETQLAVRALQRALAMEPNNPMPHYLLAQSYRSLGRNEDADRELKLFEQLRTKDTETP
jgi:tetratricopeptide (TPR) repeat protein